MEYDVIVVGGGHAGIEAALAAAHLNFKTLLITINFKKVGNMPCNPSIGGSAKGIVVREIDALGGMMGKFADHHYLQMKMLNTGKGPGVQCLRAQQDKIEYPSYIQDYLKKTENLFIIEDDIIDLLINENTIYGVKGKSEQEYLGKTVILATGTYLDSYIFRGKNKIEEGPDGEPSSIGLSQKLRELGIKTYRLKTGTPPRIKKDSIDFSKSEIQLGSDKPLAFSYETHEFIPLEKQVPCYLTYTTLKTHNIIKEHLKESALYSGLITGVGPRYCPSIESKIVTFKDKERHQLFLEPESRFSDSIYIQGFSTSMPEDVQDKMIKSLPGFENAEFLKYAYAIEYDAITTDEYSSSLELKKIHNLFIAGQICGTSGYEEAAGLGLIAGINATLKLQNKEPLVLRRDQAYIGVMVDDLITKGTSEPYRLLSSRAEFRLLLRHDNADLRLTEIGYSLGLISKDRYEKYLKKMNDINYVISILEKKHFGENSELNDYLSSLGYSHLKGGILASELLKRPLVKYLKIKDFIPELRNYYLENAAIEEIEIIEKYEGYIVNQKKEAENFRKLEKMLIPLNIDYLNADGLRLEARQKLDMVKPFTIGQASRISGVNPSDIAILIMIIKRLKHEH